MDRVRKQIQVDYAYRLGISGRGVNVCVMDTGIYPHADFDRRIFECIDFTKDNKQFVHDFSGHGTHVSGILAGSGRASRGRYQGIAYRSGLIILKILDRNGNGNIEDMFQAFEWILKHASEYQIKIVNVSIGIPRDSSLLTEETKRRQIEYYLRELHERRILIVTAAGNEGDSENTISMLGESDDTLCVGCHDGAYRSKNHVLCADYSGCGNRNSFFIKPDLVAPGTEITSCGIRNFRDYTKKSGTSMACPIISGIAALLTELNPNASTEKIMQEIRMGTEDLHLPYYKQGYGMIDCKRIFEKY